MIDKIDKPPDLKPAVVAASQASVSIVHIPGSLTLPALHNGPIAPTPAPTNTVPLVHVQANHTPATNHIPQHMSTMPRHNPSAIDAELKPEVSLYFHFYSVLRKGIVHTTFYFINVE